MLQKLVATNHTQTFRGPISITRIESGNIFENRGTDLAFGPLAIIDHAVIKKEINH